MSHHEVRAAVHHDFEPEPNQVNPLYVDRNRTRVTIDFEGLLSLREVFEQLHLDDQNTLADNLIMVDYRKTEDYC